VAAVAIASAALICGLSAAVMRREWGGAARWPAVALVPVTTLMLMSSGAFPFAAGLAAAASVAFSPLAGLLLATLLAAALFGRPGVRRRLVSQRRLAAGIALALVAGAVLQRAFPSGGRYPFAAADVGIVLGFCLLGLWPPACPLDRSHGTGVASVPRGRLGASDESGGFSCYANCF
jgi:hypothetical protein